MISIGTTLEHELRHYHDFLLSYGSLHSYWQRAQAAMNAEPILGHMLHDPDIDTLVFPAIEWARTDLEKRRHYLAEALGRPNAYERAWAPPVLEGAKPQSSFPKGALPLTDETYRHSLFVIRDQLSRIESLRGGIDNPQFPFRFTPRFVAEHSSLLVQCASVQQTYGFEEMDLFMNRLAADGSLYARFFSGMVLVFSGRGLPRGRGSVAIVETENVDWRALGVAVTWCFCGSASNPELLRPVDRMARLIEAVVTDRKATFPPRLGFGDLFRHLDKYFEVETASAAANRNSTSLRDLLQRSAAKIVSAGGIGRQFKPLVDVFEGLLDERDRVVARILEDPEGYMDVGRYVRALPQWPQCPVSLNFAPAGIVVSKEHLAKIGNNPVFEDTVGDDGKPLDGMVVEVSYPSFLPGGSNFPWRKAKDLADLRDLFDMFFDPQQIGVDRENQIKRLIAEVNGKALVRFIP